MIKAWFQQHSKKEAAVKPDLKRLKTFRNKIGDGKLELSFILPVPFCEKSKRAALAYAEKMGFKDAALLEAQALGEEWSAFVVCGVSGHTIDYHRIKTDAQLDKEPRTVLAEGLGRKILEQWKRKIVLCAIDLENDPHKAGIDFILNRKGYLGNCGLEACQGFKIVQPRSDLSLEGMQSMLASHSPDILLFFQEASEKDRALLKKLKDFLKLLEKETALPKHLLKVLVGPKITPSFAAKNKLDLSLDLTRSPLEIGEALAQALFDRAQQPS